MVSLSEAWIVVEAVPLSSVAVAARTMLAEVRLKALLFVFTATPLAIVSVPVLLASESALTVTGPVVVTLPLNMTPLAEMTFALCALIPCDSRKLPELITARFPSV